MNTINLSVNHKYLTTFKSNSQKNEDVKIPKNLKIATNTIMGAVLGGGLISTWYMQISHNTSSKECFNKAGKWGALVGGLGALGLSVWALKDDKKTTKLDKQA